MVSIKWIGSPNYRATSAKKKFLVLHWMVGTLAGTDRLFQSTSNRVATNYGVGPSAVHQYVKDDYYAFGSGTTYANTYGISIEHEGGYLVNGKRKKPTKATLNKSAELCAQLARTHGLGTLKVGVNVFPHSHFVATECPGTLDMAYICRRANKLNKGSVPKTPGKKAPAFPLPDATWYFGPRYPLSNKKSVSGYYGHRADLKRWQKQMKKRGWDWSRYGCDGLYGGETAENARAFQAEKGLKVDGLIGPVTWAAAWTEPVT